MSVALYVRISRDATGEGLGVDRQEQDCRAVALQGGLQVSHCLVDNDISAYSGRRRPGYLRLLELLRTHQVDTVIAWAPERLHRSPRELEDFIELLDRTGASVRTVKSGVWDLSTPHHRLLARMLGAVSRAESENISSRVQRAHQQAKSAGFWRGPIPYGMRASTNPGLPERDPQTAPLVEEMLNRVQRGDALTRIAADLNKAGHVPRRGRVWTHTGVLRLVSSPALGGLLQVDGELQPAAFKGLVSAEGWRAAQATLARRPKGEVRRPREQLTLLGGILVCAQHGVSLVGGSGDRKDGRTYSAQSPGLCCVSVARGALDKLMSEVVIARLSAADAAVVFQPAVDLTLDDQLCDLRRRRDELADLLTDGLLPAASARPRLQALADAIQELESKRSPVMIEAAAFDRPRETWLRWSQPQRREVLRLLFDQIAVQHVGTRNGPSFRPERLQLTWSGTAGN